VHNSVSIDTQPGAAVQCRVLQKRGLQPPAPLISPACTEYLAWLLLAFIPAIRDVTAPIDEVAWMERSEFFEEKMRYPGCLLPNPRVARGARDTVVVPDDLAA
jgi:hypothetical protein